jgi:hypothetical protein
MESKTNFTICENHGIIYHTVGGVSGNKLVKEKSVINLCACITRYHTFDVQDINVLDWIDLSYNNDR